MNITLNLIIPSPFPHLLPTTLTSLPTSLITLLTGSQLITWQVYNLLDRRSQYKIWHPREVSEIKLMILAFTFHTWHCSTVFFSSSRSSLPKYLVILRLVVHVFKHVAQRWFILCQLFLPNSASRNSCKAFATDIKPRACRLTTLPSSHFDQLSCQGSW